MRSRRLWNEVRTPDSSRHWPPERRLRAPKRAGRAPPVAGHSGENGRPLAHFTAVHPSKAGPDGPKGGKKKRRPVDTLSAPLTDWPRLGKTWPPSHSPLETCPFSFRGPRVRGAPRAINATFRRGTT